MPLPRAQLVRRSHLTERLTMAGALTLVSAPAGFGKTTLLAQWFSESGTPTAWLSLEPEDNEPVRFLSYLIAALQTLDPYIGTTALAFLHTPQPAELQTVLALLINDLMSWQRILEVLDMHRTGFSYDSLQDQDVATGYVRSWSMMGILGRFLVDRGIFGATRHGYTAFHRFLIDGAPYGGLLGPVSELGNFLKAYLGGGTFHGRRLLEPSSIAEMLTPQRNQRGEELSTSGHEMPQRVGLGWHLAGDGEMPSWQTTRSDDRRRRTLTRPPPLRTSA